MATASSPRIVSLLASGTEIAAAMGLGDHLVGISHECDHPARLMDRPRVSRPHFDPDGLSSGEIDQAVREAMAEYGSVYRIDGELLEALAPDLVLTQAVCEVCAVPTAGVQEELTARGVVSEVVSLDAHTIEEILASIRQVGVAAGAGREAERTVASLRERLDGVREALQGRRRPRLLALEWLDPAFTPGHWVPEMIELAGAENLVGTAGRPSSQHAWDDLTGLDPDVLLIMPCGYDLDASLQDAAGHAEHLAALAPRAIEEGRAYVVDGSAYFNRSGPRFVDGVEILAGLVHPDVVPAPAPDRGRAWEPAGV